jgi:dTDP-4-dehydrorhamnose reductase
MGMGKRNQPSVFEIWGGVECTINRVGDEFHDQFDLTGHYARQDDIERIASLGITKLRYPVLWEKHQRDPNDSIDWTWSANQLGRLQQVGIDPIVGLLHHGSGPAYTDLLDKSFAEKLAAYAGQVARTFPWVSHYTPVNEPLTTARFSGLYGFWYPHKRSDLDFLKMVLNQVRGVVLSMQAIRQINSDAKLVQTEDLGKTYTPPSLRYQGDFENERRWLTFDLLAGKVNRSHALWDYLIWAGLTERELRFFEENTCIPDIGGFNYYLTSERYLDPETEYYPRHLHGGNGRDVYVDTEAIRIPHGEPFGLQVLLMEAWDRLKIPLAVTEAYLSCSEDEQVRWLNQVLSDVETACINGVDIRAITFWALLGEFGWNKLVTSLADGEYEAGAFDVSRHPIRETLTANFVREVCRGKRKNEPWLNQPGWWQREDRFYVKSSLQTT